MFEHSRLRARIYPRGGASAAQTPSDAVARLWGDEFAIVLSGIRDEINAGMVADKVVAAAFAAFEIGDLHLLLGASVGVAFSVNASVDLSDLVARADVMLYQAKQAGRGRRAGGGSQSL
jgi:diguanylate cyclase (GGDEF)-like protein